MNETKLRSIEQLEAFLKATPEIEFTGIIGDGGDERYAHISRVLKRFDYPNRKRHDRGVILAYLKRTSSYSRAQIKRLVARWQECRLSAVPLSKRYGTPAAAFARKYTAADISLLVEMDRANENVCGPAVVHLLQRAFMVYGDQRYERLAGLSVSHLYNLRKRAQYQSQRIVFTKTRAVCNPIGIRKPPRPDGRAGWVRIEQTKSRARHSNDNALAESKNASVVRKHMGYSHIPQRFASVINQFYEQTFNPWLNLHRPCLFATEVVNDKGKVKKVYKHEDVKTPLECLAQLKEQGRVRFKKGVSLATLQAQAREKTDLQAAREMQQAKADLFQQFNKTTTKKQG